MLFGRKSRQLTNYELPLVESAKRARLTTKEPCQRESERERERERDERVFS